jgi:hypothetical protein
MAGLGVRIAGKGSRGRRSTRKRLLGSRGSRTKSIRQIRHNARLKAKRKARHKRLRLSKS